VIFLLLVALAVPAGRPLSGPELDKRTQEVASLLRCPVCQGMSVADSPSTVALDMKRQVREMLAKGYTEEQVLAYFEKPYGQFVLLKPKNRVVWILPIIILLAGAIVVIITARKLSSNPAPGTRDPGPDPYLDRVRDLVNRD
jgi:cytochrome c-type biogenesis protein CcmH